MSICSICNKIQIGITILQHRSIGTSWLPFFRFVVTLAMEPRAKEVEWRTCVMLTTKNVPNAKRTSWGPHISWNLGSLHLPCFHVGYSIGGLISGASASAQAGSWARQERKGVSVWVSMRDWRNIEAKPKKIDQDLPARNWAVAEGRRRTTDGLEVRTSMAKEWAKPGGRALATAIYIYPFAWKGPFYFSR